MRLGGLEQVQHLPLGRQVPVPVTGAEGGREILPLIQGGQKAVAVFRAQLVPPHRAHRLPHGGLGHGLGAPPAQEPVGLRPQGHGK